MSRLPAVDRILMEAMIQSEIQTDALMRILHSCDHPATIAAAHLQMDTEQDTRMQIRTAMGSLPGASNPQRRITANG